MCPSTIQGHLPACSAQGHHFPELHNLRMYGATLPSMFPSVSSWLIWIHVSVPQFQSQSNPTAPVLWVGAGWTGAHPNKPCSAREQKAPLQQLISFLPSQTLRHHPVMPWLSPGRGRRHQKTSQPQEIRAAFCPTAGERGAVLLPQAPAMVGGAHSVEDP